MNSRFPPPLIRCIRICYSFAVTSLIFLALQLYVGSARAQEDPSYAPAQPATDSYNTPTTQSADSNRSWSAQLWDPYRPEIYNVLGTKRKTGFRFGRGRLHLALGMLNTYDTNELYSDVNPQGGYILQVIPGADFVWRAPRFNITTTYRFNYRKDFGQDIQSQGSHTAGMEADYQFSRRIAFNVEEKFEKTADPADVQILERLSRMTNEAGAGIIYHTPGDDLETSLKYRHTWREYNADLAALSFFNNKVSMTSRINLASRFRFLPKSVASFNVEYGQTSFRNDPTLSVNNNNSQGIAGTVGLASQLTRKLSATGDVGVSAIYFDAGPDTTVITGGVALNFRPALTTAISIGYRRSVQVSTFTNFYKDHRFSLDANWKFARRFESYIRNHYAFVTYSGPNVLSNGESRDDFVIQGLVGVSFQLVEWGKVRLEYQHERRDSNATDPFFGNSTADFTKHLFNLGLDFYY